MSERYGESQPQRDLGRTIARNTAFITLGSIALKALNFSFGVYVVRRLGDDRFGQYAIVLAFVGLFQIFAELGMSQYVMREMARDRSKTGSLFWNLVALRLLLAIAGIVGISLGAAALGYAPELVLGVLLHTSGFLLSAIAVPLETVLRAHERLGSVAAMVVVGQLTFISLGSIFLLGGLGFVWLIIAGSLSILPQIGLAAWAIKRHRLASLALHVDPQAWPRLIRSGLPFGVISLTLTISFSIDAVMLSMFQPERVVGWYNVAYGLIFALTFFFGGFKEAIVPSLSRAYVVEPTHVERWYHGSVKFILIVSLPMAVGGMLLAFPLIRFLYTDAFLPSAPALQILIWDIPFRMFAGLCGNMTTIIGDERAAARIYTINAAANVILNVYAIPRFGLIGAALVTVVTDLIGALQFHILLRHKLRLPDMKPVLGRVLIASALMGLAVAALGDLPLFALAGLGGATYLGLILALRLLNQHDLSAIARLLRRRTVAPPAEEAAS